MIICEFAFEIPNPDNPNYSKCEIDFYSWIKLELGRDHRLSIRKNLKTGEFEIYRFYSIYLGTGEIEIAFKSKDLAEALKFANKETKKYHNFEQDDQICQHEEPFKATDCKF